MNDDVLQRLLEALDTATDDAERLGRAHKLSGDLEVAALRLQCLSQRLGQRPGATVSESPYLAFLRRTVELDHRSMAASA